MNMCAWLEMIIRNGMVGDWTLRDGKFMESFRLPRPGEKLETLKRKNPMPGEDRIHFNEASHVYSWQVRDTQHCPLGGADKSGLQGAEEERVREDLCIPIQTGEDSRSC